MCPWFESRWYHNDKRTLHGPLVLYPAEPFRMNMPMLDPHLHDLLHWIDETKPNRIGVIMDRNTERHCLPLVSPLLPPHTDFLCLSGIGEDIKRIEHAHAIWSSLDEAGFDRNGAIIALGGGTVTDLAGFVASTYLRGLDFWLIPTTLLGMVDAATGGKTGINLGSAKNRIGTFAAPAGVSLCPAFLDTLPERHLLAGLAEHVKHLLLALDPVSVLERIEQLPSCTTPLNSDRFSDLITESVTIKQDIVAQDATESSGIRKQLNLGHTAGHALESWAMEEGHALLHGEAVGWGLGVELALSSMRAGVESESGLRLLTLSREMERVFPSPVPAPEADALWRWARMDKKNEGERVLMVLLSEDGTPIVDVPVTFSEFEAACQAVSKAGGKSV